MYWNQTMEDNRGEVQVDQTAYYPAIRADFMELTQADWTYMNMQDAVSYTHLDVYKRQSKRISPSFSSSWDS